MDLFALHKKKIKSISKELKGFKKSEKTKRIRFTHGSTNSTRVQDKSNFHLITITDLNKVIKIDTVNNVAIVEPNVSMEELVDACLEVGLVPKVVTEFPGITCGGAVNGAALEASSFRYGQFNDTCREYEVILGTGEVLTVNKNKEKDLFYGISGSYGSLALITLITIELIPAKPYVAVSFVPIKTHSIVDVLSKKVTGKYDYIEALVLDKNNSLLITGKLSTKKDFPLKTFSKANDDWFIVFAKQQLLHSETHSVIPIKEYLFRYDRGAFWMGEHAFNLFHIPFNKLTRFLFNPFMNTRTMYKGLHDTNIAQTLFIQDFYIPLSQTKKFLNLSFDKLTIFPLWLCPIKSTNSHQKLSPHYLKGDMLVDVGIWGPISDTKKDLEKENKRFENHLESYGGRKMFYAESFYSEQEFWKIYDKKWYSSLRRKYKAENIFPTIWEKVTVKKRYAINKKKILKTMLQAFLT
jgi:delta24-sterol reductase